MVVRKSNASFCSVNTSSFTVVATVTDTFDSAYFDSTLNILIAYTKTSNVN